MYNESKFIPDSTLFVYENIDFQHIRYLECKG